MSVEDSEDLITKSEQATAGKVGAPPTRSSGDPELTKMQFHPSHRVEHDHVASVFEEAQLRLTSLFRVCKNSTVECLGYLLDCFHCGFNALVSILKVSGKERGPGATHGEL